MNIAQSCVFSPYASSSVTMGNGSAVSGHTPSPLELKGSKGFSSPSKVSPLSLMFMAASIVFLSRIYQQKSLYVSDGSLPAAGVSA